MSAKPYVSLLPIHRNHKYKGYTYTYTHLSIYDTKTKVLARHPTSMIKIPSDILWE